MAVAHPLIGIVGGIIAALLAYFAAGWPLPQSIGIFLVAGSVICGFSGALALLCCSRHAADPQDGTRTDPVRSSARLAAEHGAAVKDA